MKNLIEKIYGRVMAIESNILSGSNLTTFQRESQESIRIFVDEIKDLCERNHDHGVDLVQFGDMEPSCPSCHHANAMIHESVQVGPMTWVSLLTCRDCAYRVREDQVTIRKQELKNKGE